MREAATILKFRNKKGQKHFFCSMQHWLIVSWSRKSQKKNVHFFIKRFTRRSLFCLYALQRDNSFVKRARLNGDKRKKRFFLFFASKTLVFLGPQSCCCALSVLLSTAKMGSLLRRSGQINWPNISQIRSPKIRRTTVLYHVVNLPGETRL